MNKTSVVIAAAAAAVVAGGAGIALFTGNGAPLPCVRAPLDGGTDCLRDDGTGPRFYGTGNVFDATQASGSNCEPVAAGCPSAGGVVFGDDPNQTL